MTQQQRPASSFPHARVLDVELLALDLSSCTRCTGTLANIEKAFELVGPVADSVGTTLRLRKRLVTSEEEARRHRFTSSPTIRIAGRDIVFETQESACGSCSDLCGCSEGTDCRIWSYQGEEHEEAPVGLVVEALLKEIVGTAQPAPGGSPARSDYELPENLRRFFVGKAAKASGRPGPESGGVAACCPPSELATCCAPEEKAGCCAPAASTCGCA